MTGVLSGTQDAIAQAVGWQKRFDFSWTQAYAGIGLPDVDVKAVSARVKELLREWHMVFDNEDQLVERCVTSLLVGHLILQGPPGTGKTTLARALAKAFDAHLEHTTATSEWSPYHVIGGLRPNKDGGLQAHLGVVPTAVLECAEVLRKRQKGASDSPVAVWLLIDEFNRAEIDRAIGSLYTLLSSCDSEHMKSTPIELWFAETESSAKLWVPASFRIIGTMNDLDTNFVSQISQGLRRRFQFVTVTVPGSDATNSDSVQREIQAALESASAWLARNYPGFALSIADSEVTEMKNKLGHVISKFRSPNETSWPVGTAQIVDIIKAYLVSASGDPKNALDLAVADRLIAQMNSITPFQYSHFVKVLKDNDMHISAREVEHHYRPYIAL